MQVNARGNLQITEGQPQGTIGPWLKHWTYDALGRVIRVQSPMPAEAGILPQAYTERFYYDGDRRIVRLASIVQLEAGGKPILIKDEAGNGYLYQLAMVQDREWVWDPDGGDALLAQIDLLDNDRLAYVLGSLSGDPAVLIDEVGTPLARYGFDPYGNVLELDTLAPHAALPIGHKGLFFDRLDQPTTTNPLAAGAKGHYFNRARTYAPKLGRFLQPDPNATGLPVRRAITNMGREVRCEASAVSSQQLYGDGVHLQLYCRGNALLNRDETGLMSYLDITSSGGAMSALTGLLNGAINATNVVMGGLASSGAATTAWAFYFAANGAVIAGPSAGLIGQLTEMAPSADTFGQYLRDQIRVVWDTLVRNSGNGGGGGGGGGPPPRVLQTGGHTIQKSTCDALGITREQAKMAMEALKRDIGQSAANHGHKILSNGDVLDAHTGQLLGNLFSYIH